MACRFPGAENYHEFWANLEKGLNSISLIPNDRWDPQTYYSPDPTEVNKSISQWGGFLRSIDGFDGRFFSISPREATRMDPQQRIMLELSWACLEDAGYNPLDLAGSNTGILMGVCNFDYKELLEKFDSQVEGHTSTGTYTCLIPNRISYIFDFHGPSLPVDTACSSSLVAIHQAMDALRKHECEMALVGGDQRTVLSYQLYFFQQVGHALTFGAMSGL
ncbi:MAG: polyketide synthase [Synechococcaceae cyanobacterium SM2_3_1]|nr:polyketide synthase [Synechococcaceae cyanobacterium SM2_3_1]